MIKVEKIFPEVDDGQRTITRIDENAPPGMLVHNSYKKGYTTRSGWHKTGRQIYYIIKGEVEVYVHNRVTGYKVDFRATDGMLIRVPPGIATSMKFLKDTSYIWGIDNTGGDDEVKLDFEFEKVEEKPLTQTKQ